MTDRALTEADLDDLQRSVNGFLSASMAGLLHDLLAERAALLAVARAAYHARNIVVQDMGPQMAADDALDAALAALPPGLLDGENGK